MIGGIDAPAPVVPLVTGRCRRRDEQVGIGLPIAADAVVQCLRVEAERTAEREFPSLLFIFVVLGQGHFVGIVPKVILQGGAFRGRCNPIEFCLYPMQAGFGHHAVVQREGSEMKRVVGMGVGGNIARSQIRVVVCRRALLQAVHIHSERIGALGIPY